MLNLALKYMCVCVHEMLWYLEESWEDIGGLAPDYKQAGVEFAEAGVQVL